MKEGLKMSDKVADVLLKNNKPEALELAKVYAEMTEPFRRVVAKMFDAFCNAGVRNLGELSAAELAIKLVMWFVANKVVS